MYMQFLRRFNIRFRLMMSLLLGILLFTSVLLYSSKLFSEILVKNHLFNYLEVTQREIGVGIEFTLDEVTSTSVRLLENDNIYSLISDKNIRHDEKQIKLKSILNNLSIDKQVIGDIFIVTNDGEQFNYYQDISAVQKPDDTFISKIKDGVGTIVWGPIEKDKDGNAYILTGEKYRNYNTGQDIGYLVMYIRESSIYDIYKKKTPYSGYSFLISGNDYIVSHQDKTKVGSRIFDQNMFEINGDFEHRSSVINGKSSIIAISKFDDKLGRLNCYWKIVSIINEDNLFLIIKKINYYIAIIEIVIAMLSVLISLKVSSSIVGPIRLLKSKLINFGKGDVINPLLYSKTGDEIWELEKSYNDMISRISNLIEKNNEDKEKQRELELTALQAQINPHFLYNTLDAIGWIAKLKKQKDIEKLVLALAGFFRISLHKGDKFITVREEIELVKSFVTIELIRFPDKFDIEFAVDEDILDISMLKITIQPIVENAIKHGLSSKFEKGNIIVKGQRVDNDLLLEVIDDGIGFDVSEVLSQKTEHQTYSGYGIKNVDERIKLEYGKNYGISINSIKDIGTHVKVRLGVKHIA